MSEQAEKEPMMHDPRWVIVQCRDSRADGHFYYSVSTTGVYCIPSCGARRPKPQHVRFYSTAEEAEAAGFRPCKRCKPDQLSLRARQQHCIEALCRLIEEREQAPTLRELAQYANLSPYHLQRLFKTITGISPKAYADAQRSKRVRAALTQESSVTSAIYAAGYGTNASFYEKSSQLLGMNAKAYRAGGKSTVIRFALGECSLGAILVAVTAIGVCAIELGDDPEVLICNFQDRFPQAELIGADPEFEQLVAQMVGFIENPTTRCELPLDIQGTVFQQRVWQALQAIPVGKTVSYAELAQQIGAPKAVRAVANACAANKLAVAIPCHRVVRTDGSLSGYRWGIERKRTLLDRERQE